MNIDVNLKTEGIFSLSTEGPRILIDVDELEEGSRVLQ